MNRSNARDSDFLADLKSLKVLLDGLFVGQNSAFRARLEPEIWPWSQKSASDFSAKFNLFSSLEFSAFLQTDWSRNSDLQTDRVEAP